MLNECCVTCKHRLSLEKWDYSNIEKNGVPKSTMPGYACMIFASEGTCVWIVGTDPAKEICECYERRKDKVV